MILAQFKLDILLHSDPAEKKSMKTSEIQAFYVVLYFLFCELNILQHQLFFQSLMRLVSRLKAWAQSTLNVSGDPTKSKWKRHPLCENHQISLWQSWHSYEHIRWSVENCITFFFHHLQLTLHSTFVIPKRYQDLQILTWSMLAKTCHFTGQMNSAWKFSVTPIYNVAFVLM